MPPKNTYPDFAGGMPIHKISARKMQIMSDSARAAFEKVGHGLTSQDKRVSLRVPAKQGPLATLLIVAVVVKPTPAQHTLIVREVHYESEGADFAPDPDAPPEPLPVVQPTPGTLRWEGARIVALPGYTDSVADFAATVFDDIERNDDGTPVYVDGKTVEIPPDDTTILHWLYLRPQGPPMLIKMGGGGSDMGFAVVTKVEPADPEQSAHTSFIVEARPIRRIPGWPPEPPDPPPENPPDEPQHGGWAFAGPAAEIATYPGIPAIYYAPFVWDSDEVIFPDIPILRTFTVDGETYLEQTMRWATIEVGDDVRLSACTPITRRTEEMP